MPQEFKIAMLGASGVGKTSLLTAMYEQFEETIGHTNLQIIPDLQSAALLQERLVELKSLLCDFEDKGDEGNEGIGRSNQPKSFTFDIEKKGAKPSVSLHFKDFPGAYLSANSRPDEKKFIEDLLSESVAVLIAIDAPALMERNGYWHDAINRPEQITNFLKRVYVNIKSPRLVILAPVRCEKYLQDERSATALLKRVQDRYGKLLELYKYDALRPWVVSVVTPVQTVGNVVFSHIDEIDGTPRFYFRKTSLYAEYSPKDSEQPLRYLLQFMLKLHIENRNWNWGPFSLIRVWLGWDEHLKEAARKAGKDRKSTGGFAVLQGEKWLIIE